MRVLSLDIGTVRIGVAISDPEGRMAFPVETLAARPEAAAVARIAALVDERAIARVVAGLPLDLGGREGAAVRRTRRFLRNLASAVAVPIDEWDERLSSAAAEQSLVEAGVRRARRREVVDQVAATLILQSWLDAHRGSA